MPILELRELFFKMTRLESRKDHMCFFRQVCRVVQLNHYLESFLNALLLTSIGASHVEVDLTRQRGRRRPYSSSHTRHRPTRLVFISSTFSITLLTIITIANPFQRHSEGTRWRVCDNGLEGRPSRSVFFFRSGARIPHSSRNRVESTRLRNPHRRYLPGSPNWRK